MMDQVVRVSRSFHPGTHLASLCVDVPRARAASLVLRALAGEAAAASKQTTPGLAAIRLGFWRQLRCVPTIAPCHARGPHSP